MPNHQDLTLASTTFTQHHRVNPSPPAMAADDDAKDELDEPPELAHTPRPMSLKLQHSAVASFGKSNLVCDRKESLLTSALKSISNAGSSSEDELDKSSIRGKPCVSTWSNHSGTTAELTSDGGCTSPGTRTSTPSPPLPPAKFHGIIPIFNKVPFQLPAPVVSRHAESVDPLQNAPLPPNDEEKVEAALGRKRCIMFACGRKTESKPVESTLKVAPAPTSTEPSKRVCTVKFACPARISFETSAKTTKPRRTVSPAPLARRMPLSPGISKVHRGSDSTLRNKSPISIQKVPLVDRTRRLSSNSDLARMAKYRFHEFASSEEEIEEWTQEVTCHRKPLTIQDTLKLENELRKLGEEAEEEALEDEEEEDDTINMDDDDLEDVNDVSDAFSDRTDEGFQTDDEDGFAVSDNESDAGSDYNWWAPEASTAATSLEHLGQLRLKVTRTVSESSIGSLESRNSPKFFHKPPGRHKKSRPVNIRDSNPELPDSTDFVCGTLDEDRPAEEAYMSTLERRRAAKHKITPQDIDPSFPASDPELPEDNEDEDELFEGEQVASESDFMMHGRMDLADEMIRGRLATTAKKPSPQHSPLRLRSPPPPMKRSTHRSPPPRKVSGQSPKRRRSPPQPMRLRSPLPSHRGSTNPPTVPTPRSPMAVHFGGIGERPALFVSASMPRTPMIMMNPFDLEEEEVGVDEMPVRRAIDIQVGLEKKRQRRREQLYRKQHRKGAKEKRPAPGKGAERMREMGLAAHAHKGKTTVFGPFQIPIASDTRDIRVLSV